MHLHDCQMDGISRREASISQNKLFGALGSPKIDGKHFVRHAQNRIECRLYIVKSIDGAITAQNLLQNLGIRYQSLSLTYTLFQDPLRIGFKRAGSPHKVHRDVGVYQNHE